MMIDPYVYPGTNILKNRLDIRDAETLKAFETEVTAQRLSEGPPFVSMTADGYRELHRHIFQDVYDWAGELRSVNVAKPGALFCRVEYVKSELIWRFDKIRTQNGLRGFSPQKFARCAAEHLSELNAIHPFREGNGRTVRFFLRVLGRAGRPPHGAGTYRSNGLGPSVQAKLFDGRYAHSAEDYRRMPDKRPYLNLPGTQSTSPGP